MEHRKDDWNTQIPGTRIWQTREWDECKFCGRVINDTHVVGKDKCNEVVNFRDGLFYCPIHGQVSQLRPMDPPGTEDRRFVCLAEQENITA
jgi:hypothetical protein